MRPTIEFFWTRYFDDGTYETQWDTETGEQNHWVPIDGKTVVRATLTPFSNEFAAFLQKKGEPVIPTNNQSYEYVFREGDDPVMFWTHDVEYGTYYECGVCGFSFMHTEHGKFATCPNCGAHDEWFCEACKEFKDAPTFKKGGQVECPDCSIPVGLVRIRNVFRKVRADVKTAYKVKTTRYQYCIAGDNITLE